MILSNIKILNNGLLRKATIFIQNGLIHSIIFNNSNLNSDDLEEKYKTHEIIDCQGRIAIPGLIDIHSHLRDLKQSEKETFLTGTYAAAYSGITTVFNMPNTNPPANTEKRVLQWMERAKDNIYVDVYFIAAVPNGLNRIEIEKILNLGVIGFKIYPHSPLGDINWMDQSNFKKILNISSQFGVHIFIHPEWQLSKEEKDEIQKDYFSKGYQILKYHNNLHPPKAEDKFVNYALETYKSFISENNLKETEFPSLHFCHISCKESYKTLTEFMEANPIFKISFELTPHHLLLSNEIELNNYNIGKVLPPLRSKESQEFLFEELKNNKIRFIGTDHAPHSLKDKDLPFDSAPSGFPGFETYPLTLLDKVCQYKLPLEYFIKISSENPSIRFNLGKIGFIKEGFEANLVIIDKVSNYKIIPKNFKTKAKFSPFENFKTSVEIWKVYLRGKEINIDNEILQGEIKLSI
ncbi:MAG: dihydroorotase family protein [Candidatus Lokiarchaeota archaeon]